MNDENMMKKWEKYLLEKSKQEKDGEAKSMVISSFGGPQSEKC